MLTASFRMTKSKISFIGLCLLLLLLAVFSASGGFQKSHIDINYDINSQARSEYISDCGWKIDESTLETADIIIPFEFGDVYEKYNQIQKKQGFDLGNYKGENVTRYTYKVLNYPESSDNIRVNLLVLKGRIIGGDVCSLDIEGFMIPIK